LEIQPAIHAGLGENTIGAARSGIQQGWRYLASLSELLFSLKDKKQLQKTKKYVMLIWISSEKKIVP